MKKIGLHILVVALGFLLAACGSNSKVDGDGETTSIEAIQLAEKQKIIQDTSGVNFTLALPFEKVLSDAYTVELSGFGLGVTGCKVKTISYTPATALNLTGAKGTTQTLYISGAFDSNCTPSAHTFSATQKVMLNGKSVDSSTVTLAYDYANPDDGTTPITPPPSTDGYSFYNATTPLIVTAASKAYDLKVQLLNDGYVVSEKSVNLKAFPKEYGSVQSNNTTTGADGYATFKYTSPSVLPANGSIANPLEIVFTDENNATYTQKIVLDFESTDPGGTTSSYALTNANDITVNYATQTKEIAVQVTKNGAPIAGESVTAKSIPVAFGRIENATVTTGTDGYARFTYIAADTLTNGTQPLELVHTDTNGITTSRTVNIKVSAVVQSLDYNLTYATTPIIVTNTNQTEEISGYVVDSQTGVGIPGMTVTISAINQIYGAITPSTAVTDDAGKVAFTYTSPHDVSAAMTTTTDMRLTIDGVTVATQPVEIRIAPTATVSDYQLINQSNITGTMLVDSTKLTEIQLVKNGIPVIDARPCTSTESTVTVDCVVTSSIPRENGRIVDAAGSTTLSGYIEYTYQAPSDEINITNYPIAVYYIDKDGKIAAEANIMMNLKVVKPQLDNYTFVNPTTPLIVDADKVLKTISVNVVDENSIGVSDQNVSITVVPDIKYGSIISPSTTKTDKSGLATFIYEGPQDVAAVAGQSTTVTLRMKNSAGIVQTETVEIQFSVTETNVSVPFVVLEDAYKEINITQSSENRSIEVKVFEQGTNVPFTSGEVKVSLPPEVIEGVDVGSFASYSALVGSNGKATFSYTGPKDLESLIASGRMGATFEFYHSSNPAQKVITKTTYVISNDYIQSKYFLTTSSSDGNYTMGLQEQKGFSLVLKDDKGTSVADDKISSIVITSGNTPVGKLIDPNNNGAEVALLNVIDIKNNFSFNVKTYTLSGFLPINIQMTFEDANGVIQTIDQAMNIVVFSGPPTAMSISYAGVEHNRTTSKYVEKFVVTVTDAYNNPVNTRPIMAAGGMVEYAVDGSSLNGERNTTSPRLWHGASDSKGSIVKTGTTTAQFEAQSGDAIFKWIDFDNDKLVVFGAGFVYEALGKWDIKPNTDDVVYLIDGYSGSDRTGLYYAVGHNNRQDLCSNDGSEYVGNVMQSNFQLDASGHGFVLFEYDYHLTGKDMMLWVNLEGYQADTQSLARIGEAKKHTLRGVGFKSPESFTLPSNAGARDLTFSIWHNEAPEIYRNGHFGAAVTGKCSYLPVDHSNLHDARDCERNYRAFVTYAVSNPSDGECTIELDDESIAVSSEFSGVSSF